MVMIGDHYICHGLSSSVVEACCLISQHLQARAFKMAMCTIVVKESAGVVLKLLAILSMSLKKSLY